ncbi:MAG TPA: hypothetical protein VHM31_24445 [Polyangia bacterium]|nr:hypothetical protein [Polyangia bacterium]
MRWRISSPNPAADGLSFEILDQSGHYQPLDFSHSVFAGGGAACADGNGACFQYVVRGAYVPPAGPPPVRAVHEGDGPLPGGQPTARTVDSSLTVDSFFHTGNDAVYVNIDDKVAVDGAYVFARSYERTMWATKGLCLSGSPPDGVRFSPLDETDGFSPPQPLTDDGIYCVGIRPVPGDAGSAALAQARVATQPQLVPLDVTYTPPVETSPIIYQIVLDLEIPVASRCASTMQAIEALVDGTMNGVGVPVVKLPTVNLAVDPVGSPGSSCAQPQSRALAAQAMAQTVKQAVLRFPQHHQQFHFLYFNNLAAPLPPSLTSSLQDLFDDLTANPPNDLQLKSWLFNPGLAGATGPKWSMTQSWQSAGDPDDQTLAQALESYAQSTLPYTSQIWDDAVPVPYFSADQVAMFDGATFKVCTQSPPFNEIVGVTNLDWLGAGAVWPIKAKDPPGFLARLTNMIQVDTPAPNFVPVSIFAELQVCTRYCVDHPYVSQGGPGVLSWASSASCGVTK